MENEQIVLKISAFEQFEKQTNEKIEKLEERQNNLEELTKALSVMQNEQEHIKTDVDRKSTRLNSSHPNPSRMPSSA